MTDRELMARAIALSERSVTSAGGPFGAVIAKDGKIIAEASNSVTLTHDATAHAEVNAIRQAGAVLGTHDLSGCSIYCSCEPCPMCMAAIYWAHIDKIFFANTSGDAAHIGFDDAFIYQELSLPAERRQRKLQPLMREEAQKAFEMWQDSSDKTEY